MANFRRALLWLALLLLILLIFLCIYGAFVGAERARLFFNSVPLGFYWWVLLLALVIGAGALRRLVRVPGLLLIHAGCVFVVAGAMWGSKAGYQLRRRLLGTDKIAKGQMTIFEGQVENLVALENQKQSKEPPSHIRPEDFQVTYKELPFYIRLKDFRVTYYEPEYLYIQADEGQTRKIPVEIGTEFWLGPPLGKVTVVRAFENFKITVDGEKRTVTDDPQQGYNPALEVLIEYPDGKAVRRYAFERFAGHGRPGDRFQLGYRRVIRDYVSELEVIKDNKVVAAKNIEVNHPLHFGGYHFYQHSYDDQAHQYTILEVVSDSGLNLVWAGYLMLGTGVFWHLWLRKLRFGKARSGGE